MQNTDFKQYNITGMSCAACQARVEKAVVKVDGVKSVSVSLLTNSMGVEGKAEIGDVIRAVEAAGYGASLKGGGNKVAHSADDDTLKDRETPGLLKRLVSSAAFLLVLMYVTMGHNMWGWPLPGFFEHNHLALTLTQMMLASVVMLINGKFFKSGFSSLFHGAPNMDTLVALGSSVSFGWSVFVFFEMCGMITSGAPNMDLMELYHNQLYFESAAMIPTLITVGKTLEAKSKGKTTDALKGLMKLSPKTAVLLVDGVEKEVPIENVKVGDIFVVRPGENIPVDGIVVEGSSAVNEAALTGEGIPVDKTEGDEVSAATTNTSGFLKCRAERVGEDTTLSQIIHMVSDAAATKAPIARIADKVSGIFVPAVIGIAVIVTAGWLIAGSDLAAALERGICVLVISCPCALGLATPVAIMVGNGVGAKNGVLFKTSEALETAGKVKIIALDKTGTITAGEPRVTDVIPAGGISREELLSLAFSLEKKSEHPLAKAIIAEAERRGVPLIDTEDFEIVAGSGLRAKVNGREVFGGNERFIKTVADLDDELMGSLAYLAGEGKTPLVFSERGRVLGIISVADEIKPDSAEAIAEMKAMGLKVVMLTGDNERTAQAIAEKAGVDEIVAGVMPDGKAGEIKKLQEQGRVAMVGDGINDAPALTVADTGIAIGAGTDIAIDSADIVLMNSSLKDAAAAIRLSKATVRNIYENLFWAFFYNVVCIPLAAGLLSWKMNPMIGAAAMSLSSFTVCMNALRLNLFRFKSKNAVREAAPEEKPPVVQFATPAAKASPKGEQIEVSIEGMMCAHCEAAVKGALEALPFVEAASASHTEGRAYIIPSGEVDMEAVREAIEAEGYEIAADSHQPSTQENR